MNSKLKGCLLGFFVGATSFATVASVGAATLSVTSGLIVNLSADDVTTDGSGNVTSWNDQSGSGNDAVQGTLVSQPTLVPSVTPTGAGVIRFDSQADTTPEHLVIGGNASDFDTTAVTWFVVFRSDSSANNKRILSSAYGDIEPGSTSPRVASQAWSSISDRSTSPTDSSSGYRSLGRTATGGFNAANAGGGLPGALNVDDFFIGASSLDTSADTVTSMLTLSDGSSFSSSNTNATLQLVDHRHMLIGAQEGNDLVVDSNGWAGDLAAFVAYNRLLSNSEIAIVTEELRQAYTVAVPEPSSLGLIVFGCLASLLKRRS